jgi:hypothetical protein
MENEFDQKQTNFILINYFPTNDELSDEYQNVKFCLYINLLWKIF